jgi:thioredoxin reductase
VMDQHYDVAIVGGGAAGLSAALVLGRCRRSAWVCDDGHPRNASSLAAHCLLGNEGMAPSELLEKARRELSAYEDIAFHKDQVHSAVGIGHRCQIKTLAHATWRGNGTSCSFCLGLDLCDPLVRFRPSDFGIGMPLLRSRLCS